MFPGDCLRALCCFKPKLPSSGSENSVDLDNPAGKYCQTCSSINIRNILRAEHPEIALGFLPEIMEKSGHCDLCCLISTLVRRQWKLDDHPNANLQGIECSMYSYTCGTLDPDLEETKQSHRLYIRTSTRPLEITRALVVSKADLSLSIQLLDEDSHKVQRTRDLHGRKMMDTVDVELIKRWIKLCECEHGSACESVWWRGDSEVLPDFVRVVDVVEMALVKASPECRYVALSYVWGGSGDEYWTTMDNISVRSCPGGMSNCPLPMTIRDTIHLIQRLGERYLWIDALCIIQDSQEDKAAQIHIMDLLYSKAVFTVFASSGDSARAGLSGLSEGTRTATQHVQVIQGLRLTIPLPSVLEAITKTTWSTRGWTFQELVLSRRRLFFTKDQLYFECIKDVWCEDIVAESKTMRYSSTPIRTTRIGMFLRPNQSSSMVLRDYANAVTQFSQRRLTQESDVVAAMTALTNAMAKGYDPRGSDPKKSFRFGMWITQLDHSLLWQPFIGAACHPRRMVTDREHSRWPSWAWTGWKGAVHYSNEDYLTGSTSPDTHLAPDESLVSAWYIVGEDAVIDKLDVRRISPVIVIDDDPEKAPRPRYIRPESRPADPDVQPLLPTGTLIFRTQCAHFQVLQLDDSVPREAVNYVVFDIFPHDSMSIGRVGKITLPSSIPSFMVLEFIVLSRCTGSPGQYDTSFWGEEYYGSLLHVMAVQQTAADPRVQERIGIGVIAECAWLDAQSSMKVEERIVLLA